MSKHRIREFDDWLRWLLKQLGYRWPAYRKKRKTVRKRVEERARALGVPSWKEYSEVLEERPDEWKRLHELLSMTVSRFFREPPLFDYLSTDVFPALTALGDDPVVAWCAGCASGQEAYSLAIQWENHRERTARAPELQILATDIDHASLARATAGAFNRSEVERIPPVFLHRYFISKRDTFQIQPGIARRVRFDHLDLLTEPYPGAIHLVFCRWVAFFYFGEKLQESVLSRISDSLVSGGYLVIGKQEVLPPGGMNLFQQAEGRTDVYIRKGRAANPQQA